VGGGTVHLTQDVIQANTVNGGQVGGTGYLATNVSGGGLYVVTGAAVTQDASTSADLVNNADFEHNGTDNFGTGGPI
jgi:hypothetical protein